MPSFDTINHNQTKMNSRYIFDPSPNRKVDNLCALIKQNEERLLQNKLEMEKLINSGFRKCWYPGCLRMRMPTSNNTAICETAHHNPFLDINKDLYKQFLGSSCKCKWCGRVFFTDFPIETDPPQANCDSCGLPNTKID